MSLSTESRPKRFIFIGDSITECGRFEKSEEELGRGYVRYLGEILRVLSPSAQVLNRGVSGDRSRDVLARWTQDCLELNPDVVTIAVGINDTWRRYDEGDETSLDEFESNYRHFMETLKGSEIEIVVIEPFLLATNVEQASWREDLDPKIRVARQLAREYEAELVKADAIMNAQAQKCGFEALAADGIHPSVRGHIELARAWNEARGWPEVRAFSQVLASGVIHSDQEEY
jgi:acyl-CoA thioesterase I